MKLTPIFFTITNCQIIRCCLLTRRMNYQFMYKVANERLRISAVIVQKKSAFIQHHLIVVNVSMNHLRNRIPEHKK